MHISFDWQKFRGIKRSPTLKLWQVQRMFNKKPKWIPKFLWSKLLAYLSY